MIIYEQIKVTRTVEASSVVEYYGFAVS